MRHLFLTVCKSSLIGAGGEIPDTRGREYNSTGNVETSRKQSPLSMQNAKTLLCIFASYFFVCECEEQQVEESDPVPAMPDEPAESVEHLKV